MHERARVLDESGADAIGAASLNLRKWIPRRAPDIAFLSLCLFYGIFALSLGNAPLQDLPNHLARAHIMADLLFNRGAVFGHIFTLKLSISPYLSGDLLIAILDHYLGTEWAARLWILSSVLLLPWSVLFALRAQRVSRQSALFGAICALYLATGWFFVAGFINYQLSIACALFAYGWFLKFQLDHRWRSLLGYTLLLLAGYALHLSALVFVIAMVGTPVALCVLKRQLPGWRMLVPVAIGCMLLASHFAFAQHTAPGNWPTGWGPWQMKLKNMVAPFVRFKSTAELALLATFVATALSPLMRQPLRSAWEQGEQWLVALIFLGIYFVLPSFTQNIYYVDVRALPYALVFVLFAAIGASDYRPTGRRTQIILASLIACGNLAYLSVTMLAQNQALGRYKLIAQSIPSGSHVLPICTRPPIGRYQPFLHAGSYATSLSAAVTPYLFAADLAPHMSYFSYAHRDYAPSEFWYTRNEPWRIQDISWDAIRRQYQYILITVPWDTARIPLHYSIVARNDVAALLKIQK